MRKKFIDVVPKRSIRHVPVHTRETQETLNREEEIFSLEKPPKHSRTALWVIALVALLLVVFSFSFVITGAKVTIVPKVEHVSVAATLRAVFGNAGEFGYETLTVEDSVQQSIPATETKRVETKAQGVVVLYNKTTASERLVKNTRLETPTGLIFKLSKSIVVPPRVLSGKTSTPGSVEVLVYAESAGEKYNIGMSDFTIPGFKGNSKYTNMYARTKEPVLGGKVGTENTVSNENLATVTGVLKKQLEDSLYAMALEKKSDVYVAYREGMFTTFEDTPPQTSGDSIVVNQKAKATVVIFDRDKLATELAKTSLPHYLGLPVSMPSLDLLSFSIKNKNEFRVGSSTPLSFSLTGDAAFIYTYNEGELKKALAGAEKTELSSVIKQFPSIEHMEAVVRPFWRLSFPSNVADIHIENNLDAAR